MLDQKDLEAIGKVVDARFDSFGKEIDSKFKESEDRIIVAVGEMVEQQVLSQISTLDEKVTKLDQRVDRLEGTIANLPDKAYLDNKFSDFNGECVRRDRQTNKKIDSTVGVLQKKNVFT